MRNRLGDEGVCHGATSPDATGRNSDQRRERLNAKGVNSPRRLSPWRLRLCGGMSSWARFEKQRDQFPSRRMGSTHTVTTFLTPASSQTGGAGHRITGASASADSRREFFGDDGSDRGERDLIFRDEGNCQNDGGVEKRRDGDRDGPTGAVCTCYVFDTRVRLSLYNALTLRTSRASPRGRTDGRALISTPSEEWSSMEEQRRPSAQVTTSKATHRRATRRQVLGASGLGRASSEQGTLVRNDFYWIGFLDADNDEA